MPWRPSSGPAGPGGGRLLHHAQLEHPQRARGAPHPWGGARAVGAFDFGEPDGRVVCGIDRAHVGVGLLGAWAREAGRLADHRRVCGLCRRAGCHLVTYMVSRLDRNYRECQRRSKMETLKAHRGQLALLTALVGPLALALILVPFRGCLLYTSDALLFVAVIVAVAVVSNRFCGVFSSLLSALLYNFFLTETYE